MFDKKRLEAVDIEKGVPEKEPERQYYFMKMCHKWAQEKMEKTAEEFHFITKEAFSIESFLIS